MTTRTPIIPAPVHAGAGWLDIHHGANWDKDIDPDSVLAWHPHDSVLGQLYGTDAVAPLNIDERVRYGFEAAGPGLTQAEAAERMAEYGRLTAGWRALIEARREASHG